MRTTILRLVISFFSCSFLALKHDVCASVYKVDVEIENPINIVNENFLSLGLDASALCIPRVWIGFNTSSLSLISMCKALSPAFFRFGGTSADYVLFVGNRTFTKKHLSVCAPVNGETPVNPDYCPNSTALTAQEWIKLNEFATHVGWKLLFGLNALHRSGRHWNPDNAIKLLKFTNSLGYHPGWELGNELNAHRQLEGKQLGQDFVKLRKILNSCPYNNRSLLVGPDMSGKNFVQFLQPFLHEAKKIINATTFHHYYFSGRTATLEDFINVDHFDSLKIVIADAFKVVEKAKSTSKVWLGETSSAWGGGAPGLSDSYVAGFLWLDKLGLSAVHGIDVVVRQSLYHGNYSLLANDLSPLPALQIFKWSNCFCC